VCSSDLKFFHLLIDENELEIETPESMAALPRTTPLEELRRHFLARISTSSGVDREILEEALKLCQAKLEAAGAW
jgi:hypothetical protein